MLRAIEQDLPRPTVEVDVLVPYERGDLVSKMHEHGEIADVAHTADGTHLHALVNPGLAAELSPYTVGG